MRRALVVLMALAALLAAGPPAAAKGPWRITVRGPGIAGEVDLMEGVWPVMWIGSPDTVVGRPGEARPGATPPHVVTWYSAAGWDAPVADRVAVHFDTGAVQVLASTAGFGGSRDGWFEADERGLGELERAVGQVVADGRIGAIGYEFVTSGDRAAWEEISGDRWARRVLAVLAALAGLRPW